MLTFTERLQRRRRLWWGRSGPWSSPATYARAIHRLRDRYQLRDRTWPMDRWRCCEVWQRSLLNKWNSREFATMHGVAVPALYWSGRRIRALPLDRLPGNFVLRPAWGAGGVGTYLMAGDFDHGSQRPLTPAAMVAEIRRARGSVAPFPYLVEEFMTTQEGRCERVLEYRVYLFGDRVGAIHCTQSHLQSGPLAYQCSFFEDWTPMPEGITSTTRQMPPIERPADLDRLLAVARRLGAACGTFIRADFCLPSSGPVFGEFSSTPRGGQNLTPFADRYLGQLWQECIPDAS